MLSFGRILIAVVLAIVLEANYQYYDFKGKAPVITFTFIYNNLPDIIRSIARGAGKGWAYVTGRRPPVTLLPDHVMLCIPNSLAQALDNPAPGSPEELYLQDAEDIVRRVAKRHALPGVTYDENKNREDLSIPESGPWIAYAGKEYSTVYQQGGRSAMPVDLRQYNSAGTNLICGQTYGHEQGPQNYKAYAITFDGKKIPVAE